MNSKTDLLHKISSNPTTSDNWEEYWQQYEAAGYVNYTPQMLATIQQYVDLNGAKILEVGSGTGGNASELARLGAVVTTLDFAPSALNRTIITAQQAGVRLIAVQGDARSLPFSTATYDLVYHQGFLEHFTDPDHFLREQRRVLKDGGVILVDVPQLFNWYTVHKQRLIRAGRWPYGGWERQFSFRELTRLLQDSGFKVRDAYGRGYYPRPLSMLRNLSKIEKKLLQRDRPSSPIWHYYDRAWHWFEYSWFGCNSLQCVGVLAQAVIEA